MLQLSSFGGELCGSCSHNKVEMTAAQARATAKREGLELVTADRETGFECVEKKRKQFRVRVRRGDAKISLGSFKTAEEAALAYARHVSAVGRASKVRGVAAAAVAAARSRQLTPAQVREKEAHARATAESEHLKLEASDENKTGFKGVTSAFMRYHARVKENGQKKQLGSFETATEAAIKDGDVLGFT